MTRYDIEKAHVVPNNNHREFGRKDNMCMTTIYHMNDIFAEVASGTELEQLVSERTTSIAENALEHLASFLESPCAQSLLEFEKTLVRDSIEMCGKLVALAICLVHRNSNWSRQMVHQVQHQSEGKSYRQLGQRKTKVRLPDGKLLSLVTPYLAPKTSGPGRRRGVGRRGKTGVGRYPILESLGIRFQATPGLLNEVAQTSSRLSSFEEVQTSLQERGCVLDVKTVRRLALSVGEEALVQRSARLVAAQEGKQESDEFVGQRVVIGTDGGRLRTRVEKRGRRRASGHRGYQTPWREPKLVVAYVVDKEGRLARDHTPLYDATMGNAGNAFAILLAELKLRGASKALELCVVGDGARWIWNRVDELAEGLGLEKEKVVRVADFYHVTERLTELSKIPKTWSAREQKRWYNKMYNLVWNGQIDDVIGACQQLQKGRRGKAIGEHLQYLEGLKEYMQYNVYREQGWPCGSGAIESAMRRVVNLRLKGPGLFWKEENAERMLHLRSYQKAGRWEEMFLRVLNQSFDGKPRKQNDMLENQIQHAA